MLVEGSLTPGMVLEPVKVIEFSVEGKLEGAIVRIFGILVAFCLEISWESVEDLEVL
jgi:hypothetical protein